MITQPLGKTGLSVSRLAYGCMRIAGTWDPKEITPAREAAAFASLRAAYEAGYTLFDHADIYAQTGCESLHGKLLKEEPSLRDKAMIATKCGIRFGGDPHPDSPHRYDFAGEHIVWSCEQSLTRLNTDYVDIYQLHRPDVLMDVDEVAEAFAKLKEQGKVRYFGVSNFSPSFVDLLQSRLPDPLVVNQIEVSLSHLHPFTDGTLDQCQKDTITPLAWSPVGGGWLASDTFDPGSDWDPARAKLHSTISATAKAHGVSNAEICFAWLLKHPSRMIPIVGSTDPKRIASAVKATEIELCREEWYRLYVAARGEALP